MVRVRYSFGSRHTGKIKNIKKQRGKYPDVMKDVVRISDIILEVLDSRYIDETRNLEMEASMEKLGKRLIYVLNKADLVDVKKIEKKLPGELSPYVFVSTKSRKGARDLRDRIMIEAKRVDLGDRKRVHVGIVGYPNVGKSSIINLVARKGAAPVSSKAGYTRGMQKIRMSEGILILDTPGVIPESKYSSSSSVRFMEDAKIGARTYSDVRDPEDVVHYLMKEHWGYIERFYGLEALGDVDRLIESLGRERGFLGKGGVVDIDRTARLILRDWQSGDIRV